MAEGHRGDDIAAARIEEYDAPQLRVRTAGFEKIDERLRRIHLDHAVGDDHVGTARAAAAGLERLTRNVIDPGSACEAAGASQPQSASSKAKRRDPSATEVVGGDGLEPPTLSV